MNTHVDMHMHLFPVKFLQCGTIQSAAGAGTVCWEGKSLSRRCIRWNTFSVGMGCASPWSGSLECKNCCLRWSGHLAVIENTFARCLTTPGEDHLRKIINPVILKLPKQITSEIRCTFLTWRSKKSFGRTSQEKAERIFIVSLDYFKRIDPIQPEFVFMQTLLPGCSSLRCS